MIYCIHFIARHVRVLCASSIRDIGNEKLRIIVGGRHMSRIFKYLMLPLLNID